jgi:vacuolar protein sorting-associated protein 13A/C
MSHYRTNRYQYKHIRAEQEAARKGSPQHFLAVNMVVDNHPAIDYYDHINVLMQAVVFKFDTPFLNEVLQLLSEIFHEIDALTASDNLQREALRNLLQEHTDVMPNVVNTNRRVYVESLLLQPIKLSLCYTPVGRYKEVAQLSGVVRSVLNIFGGFAKIDADITLQSFIAENVSDNSNMFANRVTRHYLNRIISQVFRVVFGLQTLGNPMKLFTNVGTGVRQLYYEPSQGAVQGPKEFMTGLGRGAMDFLGGVTMGVTGLASAGLETVASAVEQLSFNKNYIEDQQAHRAVAPKNALHGCVRACVRACERASVRACVREGGWA